MKVRLDWAKITKMKGAAWKGTLFVGSDWKGLQISLRHNQLWVVWPEERVEHCRDLCTDSYFLGRLSLSLSTAGGHCRKNVSRLCLLTGWLVFSIQKLAVLLVKRRPSLIDVYPWNIWLRCSLLGNQSLSSQGPNPYLSKYQWGKRVLFADPFSEPERSIPSPTKFLTEAISVANTDPTPTDLSLGMKRERSVIRHRKDLAVQKRAPVWQFREQDY